MRHPFAVAPIAALVLIGAAALAPAARAAPNLDPATAPAGHYVLDPGHASLIVRVRHMGLSLYTLRFDKITAVYDYDPAHPLATKVMATVDAKSLDTGDRATSKRFADLFLNADAHPAISFVSTDLTATDADHGLLSGNLTLNGITRPVSLRVTFDGAETGLTGDQRMGFSATGTIRRSDFGSTVWRGLVGDEAELAIEVEFVRK